MFFLLLGVMGFSTSGLKTDIVRECTMMCPSNGQTDEWDLPVLKRVSKPRMDTETHKYLLGPLRQS